MTEETQTDSLPEISGVSIDSSTWEEPKVSFPGEVTASEYRWCSEKYLDSVVDRIIRDSKLTKEQVLERLAAETTGNTKLIPQWNARVTRFDAIFQLPDGSNAPANRYAGFDLVTWNKREARFMSPLASQSKANFISENWKKVFGKIEPPSVLVGKKADFEFYPSKKLGRGSFAASNILIPVKLLAPDYVYAGEVQTIIVTRDEAESDEGVGPTPEATAAATSSISYEEAVNELVAKVLPGINSTGDNATVAIIQAIPTHLKAVPQLLQEIAGGTLIPRLQAEGRIKIETDGTFAAV